jgi:hypothetical protein
MGARTVLAEWQNLTTSNVARLVEDQNGSVNLYLNIADSASAEAAGSKVVLTTKTVNITKNGVVNTVTYPELKDVLNFGKVVFVNNSNFTGVNVTLPSGEYVGQEIVIQNGSNQVSSGNAVGIVSSVPSPFGINQHPPGQRSRWIWAQYGWVMVESLLLIDNDNLQSLGQESVSIGKEARVTGERSINISAVPSHVTGDLAMGLNGGEATGNNAIAIGGAANASGESSLAFTNATATAQYAVAVGNGSQASADNSFAVGPFSAASGNGSSAYGAGAVALNQYETAIGTNTKVLNLSATTSGAVNAFLTSDGSAEDTNPVGLSNRYFTEVDTAYLLQVSIVGKRPSTANVVKYTIQALLVNNGGALTLSGQQTIGTNLATGFSAGDITSLTSTNPPVVSADNTNDVIRIQVTGVSGSTINWAATATVVKVA